jgi:hypothetical protein
MAVFAHRVCMCALVLLVWMALGSVTAAAAASPPWRQHLSCDLDPKYSGLEYCTGADGKVHVVVVDLHSPGVRLEYVIAEGLNKAGEFGECQDVNRSTKQLGGRGCDDPDNLNYYPVMALRSAVGLARGRDSNTAVVIDSDYGAGTQGNPGEFREHGAEGFTVVRGNRLDGPLNHDYDAPGKTPSTNNAVRRPWLAVSADAPLRVEFGQFTKDDGGKPDWVYTGAGGGPWLIRQGQIQTEDIRTCKNCPNSCYDGAVQTAAGLSEDRRWLFLVVDARKGNLLGAAQFMRDELATWDAIKFDGGGSSQIWYDGQTIVPGDGRQLSQFLAVIAPPGAGIQDSEPPAEPPGLQIGNPLAWHAVQAWLQALSERLRTATERWVAEQAQHVEQAAKELMAELGRQLEQRLAELEQQLADWIAREAERQMQNLLEQLCGASALAPAGLAVWVVARRRR